MSVKYRRIQYTYTHSLPRRSGLTELNSNLKAQGAIADPGCDLLLEFFNFLLIWISPPLAVSTEACRYSLALTPRSVERNLYKQSIGTQGRTGTGNRERSEWNRFSEKGHSNWSQGVPGGRVLKGEGKGAWRVRHGLVNKTIRRTSSPCRDYTSPRPTGLRVLTLLVLRALLRLRLIIQTSLVCSYMRKSARSTERFNIGNRAGCRRVYSRRRSLTIQLSAGSVRAHNICRGGNIGSSDI